MSNETKKTTKSTTSTAKKRTSPAVKSSAVKSKKPATPAKKSGVKAITKAKRPVKNAVTPKKKERTKAALENNEFGSMAKYVWYSPYKLRPVANVIRGKDVQYAVQWLSTYRTQRAEPVAKVLSTAIANAKHLKNIDPSELFVKEIFVEEGPTHRYFKPGAQGRANLQRKRLCHIGVTVKRKEQ